MSLTNPNPAGWAVGSKLTSAQQNSLGAQIAKALDKTSAGDTLAGVITIGVGGEIAAAQASSIVASTLGAIQASATGAIQSAAGSAIQGSVAGGIASTTPGGIALSGGGSDEITYTSTRTRVVAYAPLASLAVTGWTISASGYLSGPGTNSNAIIPLPQVHNGATLTTVRIGITPATHSSAPSTFPEAIVYRYTAVGAARLIIGDTVAPTVAYGAWNATTYWDVPCNLGGAGANVIDRTQYYYAVQLTDEVGGGALGGNLYTGLIATFGTIVDMRFP